MEKLFEDGGFLRRWPSSSHIETGSSKIVAVYDLTASKKRKNLLLRSSKPYTKIVVPTHLGSSGQKIVECLSASFFETSNLKPEHTSDRSGRSGARQGGEVKRKRAGQDADGTIHSEYN